MTTMAKRLVLPGQQTCPHPQLSQPLRARKVAPALLAGNSWPRNLIGLYRGSYRGKNWKTIFSAKTNMLPHMAIQRVFGVTEWSGNIFCVEIDPGSPISVSPNSGFLENRWFSTFLESPFITKWPLDLQMGPWIFSKQQRLLVERPSAKIHFEKWPQQI